MHITFYSFIINVCCVNIQACLNIYVSIYLSVSVYRYVHQSVSLPSCLSVSLSVSLSICTSVYLAVCVSIYRSVSLAVFLCDLFMCKPAMALTDTLIKKKALTQHIMNM